eukprot:g1121.t1
MLPSLCYSDGWAPGISGAQDRHDPPLSRRARLRQALHDSAQAKLKYFELVLRKARVAAFPDGERIYSVNPLAAAERHCNPDPYRKKSSLNFTATSDRERGCDGSSLGLSACIALASFWSTLPAAVDPAGDLAKLGASGRGNRKRQQVENMACVAAPLIERALQQRAITTAAIDSRSPVEPTAAVSTLHAKANFRPVLVVEFCAGTGSLALPLAACLPQVQFVLLDAKRRSLDIAQRRVEQAGLRNVEIVEGLVEEFDRVFDVGLALHACGDASDAVLERCVAVGAAYVVCPCCVGKLQQPGRLFTYPRSTVLRTALTTQEYDALAKAADHQHQTYYRGNIEVTQNGSVAHGSGVGAVGGGRTRRVVGGRVLCRSAQRLRSRRLCKCVVECDRNLKVREQGYEVRMVVMHPPEATPKNDMLLGWRPCDRHEGTGDVGMRSVTQNQNEAKSGGQGEAAFGTEADEDASGSILMTRAQLTPECATGWAKECAS